MGDSKISLSYAELYTDRVESRLKEADAVKNARESFRRATSAPPRLPIPRGNVLYNPLMAMTLFGLLGGLLAWGCIEIVQHFLPNAQTQAQVALQSRDDILVAQALHQISASHAKNALRVLDEEFSGNPFYIVQTDMSLSPAERQARMDALALREKILTLVEKLTLYCVCGILLASCLGIAQSIGTGKHNETIIVASVGSLLGLAGGAVVSFGIGPLGHLLAVLMPGKHLELGRAILTDAATWSILGGFLSAAPGVVQFSRRRIFLAVAGGCVGGAIGGALIQPISMLSHHQVANQLSQSSQVNQPVAQLIAILTIGALAGLASALFENVAKRGWLKVAEGLIAGKQFILYRNPTMIGSFPGCEIYLFNDGTVTRHHAMIHILPNGFEIEDLGSGRTLVNNRPISRTRLRDGDRIRIGKTCFAFQQKTKEA